MRKGIQTVFIMEGIISALFLITGSRASGEVRISFGYGYGFPSKDKLVEAREDGDYQTRLVRAMQDGMDLRIRYSRKSSHWGFSIDLHLQDYVETFSEIYQGVEESRYRDHDRFSYLGGFVDYSFFPARRFQPYLGAGIMTLLYVNLRIFGLDLRAPDFPATTAIKLAVGTRYRLARHLNLDANADYLPLNGIASLRLGLELVL